MRQPHTGAVCAKTARAAARKSLWSTMTHQSPQRAELARAAAAALLAWAPAAVGLDFGRGELTGSFDTTVSVGLRARVESADPALIDIHNGGTGQNLLNADDGDLNFDKGLVSSALKFTHDLEFSYRNYGGFFRGSYFYDHTLENSDELTEAAKDRVGKDAELLDAYVYGEFLPAQRPLRVRLGSQVVNWGESLTVANGINVINPVDVAKLRVPGAEIREALVPSPMLWGSLGLSENIGIESFYIITAERTKIDPLGTYYSDNDTISDGAKHLVAGFGVADEDGNIPTAGITDGRFIMPRLHDIHAKDGGEYGVALRSFAPGLNNSEFGLYYLNYHSRLPVVSFVAARTGRPPSDARYFVEYPQDIHLFGASFNTLLSSSGVALQGELSYRPNVPLQIEFAEAAMAATHTRSSGGQFASQLPDPSDGATVRGYQHRELMQTQLAALKEFGRSNPFGAGSWSVVAEAAMTQVIDMPAKSKLRFEAPGTNLPARRDIVVAGTPVAAQNGGWADQFSWGYRLISTLTYANAIGAASLNPRIAFAHDVNGNSPVPGGNFVENRKSLLLAIGSSYLESWTTELSYVRSFGAGIRNTLSDRDSVAFDVKYSF
jgi:hypothetical protein